MRAAFLILLLLLGGAEGGVGAAWAVDAPEELLPDPQMEKRAEQLGQQLRCLVCQNESIEDSNAPLARDLRHIVRAQIAEGHSDQDILHWMTQRYGEFIRLKPDFSLSTALLWLMPVIALVTGGIFALRLWSANRPRSTVETGESLPQSLPLTTKEEARLKQILSSSGLSSEDHET